MAKVENKKAEAKKADKTDYVTIGEYFSEFLESEECRVIRFALYGQCYGANKKTKKPARVSVRLPPEICDTNLKDLDNWILTIVAVPRELMYPKKKEEREEKDNGKKK
jgi:hypothetical protein